MQVDVGLGARFARRAAADADRAGRHQVQKEHVKLLLTSAGIKNPSIHDALVELLGKPIAECNALCITTASYGHPYAGLAMAWRFISGQDPRRR